MQSKGGDRSEGERHAEEKAPYTTPELTIHGDIEAVTLSVGAEGTDGVLGSGGGMT